MAPRPLVAGDLPNPGQGSAQDGFGLFRAAARPEGGGFVDVRPLGRLARDAPRIGLAGPIAELDPATRNIVVGDGATFFPAARDRDGGGLHAPDEPDFPAGVTIDEVRHR